jgi:acyl-CoA hydrolase
VTTARSDVDVIVTEYGAAQLRGCPLGERAHRLIAIAHPDHREALERIAKVASPAQDPVYGRDGPLPRLWAR